MTLFLHELKQSKISVAIWTLAITFFMVTCVVIYPEMSAEMEQVGDVFASMGSFTAAFGMDQLNFGTFMGYYSIECGNVIGLGGAFFAALAGISIIAKEEKEHTAEFLLAHPIGRTYVLNAKLGAAVMQIVILNLVVFAGTAASIVAMDIECEWDVVMLLHLAYFIMQIEIGMICYGLSAFIRRGGLGLGLGIALVLYFMNLVKNILEEAEFLKYITPFAYTDGAQITEDVALDWMLVVLGLVYGIIVTVIGYAKYTKKDIA